MKEMNDLLTRPLSRRTAIKAAVAVGAVAYARPMIETVTGATAAHAASTFGSTNHFVISCPTGGPLTYAYPVGGTTSGPGSGQFSVKPAPGCGGLVASIVDNTPGNTVNLTNEPTVSSSLNGTTDSLVIDFSVGTPGAGTCNVSITNVAASCASAVPNTGVQNINITCQNSGGTIYYEVLGTLAPKVALTSCP